MKALLLAALLVASIPSFAADSTATSTAVAPPRHPPGRPFPRPPRPMPPPPHRDHFQCRAQDRFQRSYFGEGWNLNDARRDALRSCQSRSVVKGCRVTDCGRRR